MKKYFIILQFKYYSNKLCGPCLILNYIGLTVTGNLYNVATQMEGKVLIIEIYLKIIFFLLLCQYMTEVSNTKVSGFIPRECMKYFKI